MICFDRKMIISAEFEDTFRKSEHKATRFHFCTLHEKNCGVVQYNVPTDMYYLYWQYFDHHYNCLYCSLHLGQTFYFVTGDIFWHLLLFVASVYHEMSQWFKKRLKMSQKKVTNKSREILDSNK